jgi:hypothetical protein
MTPTRWLEGSPSRLPSNPGLWTGSTTVEQVGINGSIPVAFNTWEYPEIEKRQNIIINEVLVKIFLIGPDFED